MQTTALPIIQHITGIASKLVELGRKLLPGVQDNADERRLLVCLASGFQNDCHRDKIAGLQRSPVAIDIKPAEAPIHGGIEFAIEFESYDVVAGIFFAAPFGAIGWHKIHCTSPQGQGSVTHNP